MKESYDGEFMYIKIFIVLLVGGFILKGCASTNTERFECQDGFMYQIAPQKKSIISENGVFKQCDEGKIILRGEK